MKETLEYSSSYRDIINVIGTFLGSFVIVIVMIFACVACRRNQKKDRNTSQARIEESESEYQTPDVNIQGRDASSSDGANVYTVPEPNIVYTDLDKLALKSGGGKNRKAASEPPTQYAIIDEEKLNAARKQRQEKHYENVDIRNKTKPSIYDNVAVNEINA